MKIQWILSLRFRMTKKKMPAAFRAGLSSLNLNYTMCDVE